MYSYISSRRPFRKRIRPGMLFACFVCFLATGLNNSAVAAESKKREIRLGGKTEIKRKISFEPQTLAPNNACQVDITLSYQQMHERVRVRAKLTNDVCAASHGKVTFRVRTRTPTGEARTRTFDEDWQRADDGPIEMTHFYPMDGDLDLVWVRSSRTARTGCLCIADDATDTNP